MSEASSTTTSTKWPNTSIYRWTQIQPCFRDHITLGNTEYLSLRTVPSFSLTQNFGCLLILSSMPGASDCPARIQYHSIRYFSHLRFRQVVLVKLSIYPSIAEKGKDPNTHEVACPSAEWGKVGARKVKRHRGRPH